MKNQKIVKIPLTIDSKEPKEVIQKFQNSGLFETIHVHELDVGDFDLGCLRIERKSFSDFVASWREGRLGSQVERLINLENKVGIIIIHDYDKFSRFIDFKLKAAAMKHIDNLNFVLPVYKTKDFNSFMSKILRFAKHAEDGQYLLEFTGRKTKPKPAKNRIIYFYASMPGVSETLAERLWKKFPIPVKFFMAMSRRVKKKKTWYDHIRGIGQGKAEDIEDMILQGKV